MLIHCCLNICVQRKFRCIIYLQVFNAKTAELLSHHQVEIQQKFPKEGYEFSVAFYLFVYILVELMYFYVGMIKTEVN